MDLLQQILELLHFPPKAIGWIMECVQTVSYSIGINAEYTEPFVADRELRQGDHISPYLFAICMEYLSRISSELQQNRLFKHHPKRAKLNLTHLIYADDLLLFARGDLLSVQALHGAFQQFSSAFGLKANLDKSCAYFDGVKKQVQDDILQHLVFT